MVAYSFQSRFEVPIRAGFKTQTIRATGRRRHAKPGERLQLYIGMRTRQCRLIALATCIIAKPCGLAFRRGNLVRAWHREGDVTDLDGFALNDGFTGADDMGAFWSAHNGLDTGDFEGVLIEWSLLPCSVNAP